MSKKIIIKFGTSRESKIFISKNLADEIDFYINAKNIEHSFKSIEKIVKNKNYSIDITSYLIFSNWRKYYNEIEKSFDVSKNLLSVFEKTFYNFEKTFLLKSEEEKISNFSLNVTEITYKAINYQIERINEGKTEKYSTEKNYAENYLDIKTSKAVKPKFVISPYFAIGFLNEKKTKNKEEIYDFINLNNLFFNKAKSIAIEKNFDIYFCLAFTQYVLINHLKELLHLIEKNKNKNSNFIFWIDNFSLLYGSQNSLLVSLNNLILLLRSCSNNSIILHGDFSLICVLNKNISGYNNNLVTNSGYGEMRQIFGEGGRPTPSYYLKPLHKKVSMIVFLSFLIKNDFVNEVNKQIDKFKFRSEICDCDNCKVLISKIDEIGIFEFDIIFTQQSSLLNQKQKVLLSLLKDLLVSHFALAKKEETEFLDFSISDLVKNLEIWESNIDKYEFEKNDNWFKNSKKFIVELKKILKKKNVCSD